MNDHALSLAVAFALAPAMPGIHVYAHDLEIVPTSEGWTAIQPDPETGIVLPAVLIKSQSQALASSSTVARGTTEIGVESQSDEDSSETHAGRVTLIRQTMADIPALLAAFTAAGAAVALLGKPCPTDTNPEIEQRAYRTVLTWRIGYQSAA